MTEERHPILTSATIVTVVRVVFIPVFMVSLLSPWPEWLSAPAWVGVFQPWIAAAVYTLLAATDGVDGYLARSRNEVTTFGKFLDPLADKILVAAALIALVELGKLPSWIVLVILSREFIISGLRMIASVEGVVIAASWYGKAKTVVQIVAIVMFLVKDSSLLPRYIGEVGTYWFGFTSWTVMVAAVVLTLLSMFDYFIKASDLLIGPWRKSSR